MSNKVRTAFMTKWALSEGKITQCKMTSNGGEYYQCPNQTPYYGLYKVGDFFFDKQEAIADVEKRRDRKITSLRKQIEKLQSMNFMEGA